jgi:hypothetical protein
MGGQQYLNFLKSARIDMVTEEPTSEDQRHCFWSFSLSGFRLLQRFDVHDHIGLWQDALQHF